MKNLAIITTHPIQYNAPLFRLLHERGNLTIKVFYTWGRQVAEEKYDPGFGKSIQWDIPLLDGYEYEWVENIAKDAGSHHYKGIDNPGLVASVINWKADAVLVYGWSFKSHLKVMRYFKNKIPVFFRGDSVLLNQSSRLKVLLRKLFLKWVYSHIDIALYVGTHNRAYYKSFGVKDSQLVFAPHAIDNERFGDTANRKSEVLEWRRALQIDPQDIVFLYAGKLDENKNTAMLARVFIELDTSHAHLLIAGNGTCEESLKQSFGHNSNVHFLPFQNQSQMPVLYAMADIFVLPSISETWGLSVNEAMASGKAVLVSDSCGAAVDLVQNGKNGFIFRSGDEKDLKEKMLKFLERETDLQKMGIASFEIIQNWNYEMDCKVIESLFN
ncbi:MAG: glycosyltransferase family 4 protein [Ginsengibacter sp.]